MADWFQLPNDLWCMILVKLTLFSDYIRFGSVCRSWRSVQRKIRPPLELPWLFLCNDNHDDETRGFFSLSERKTYRLKLPELVGKRCYGSSHGWLVTIDPDLQMHLFHPFSRMQIPLPFSPPFPKAQACYPYIAEELVDLNLWKIFVFFDPVSSPDDCVVWAIHRLYEDVALCRLGDKDWSFIKDEHRTYIDVIYYNQQFIGLTSTGEVVVISEAGLHSQTMEFIPRFVHCSTTKYLVELMGDLLQAIRFRSVVTDAADGHAYHTTCKFILLKLDTKAKNWVEVKSLGERALFVGYGTSMSFSAHDYPGCTENAVYFTNDIITKDLRYGYKDVGVYYLGDGTVKPYYPSNAFHPTLSPHLWFTPCPITN